MSVKDKVVAGMAILKGTAVAVATAVKKSVGRFTDDGMELVDGRAMEPPVGYQETKSIADMIAEAVRGREIQREMHEAGHETFEEADDFDVGDDFDPTSPYEAFFEPITEADLRKLAAAGYIVVKDKPEPPPKPLATPQASPEPPQAAGAKPGSAPPAEPVTPS